MADKPAKKRGPKGGIKHQPGRGHARKSSPAIKRRFAKRAKRKRQEQDEEAKRVWKEWDELPDEVKRLLGPSGEPTIPRPRDE